MLLAVERESKTVTADDDTSMKNAARANDRAIVEHHMGMVMEIADEIAVLDNGELIATGRPDAVSRDSKVIEAYLKGARVDA